METETLFLRVTFDKMRTKHEKEIKRERERRKGAHVVLSDFECKRQLFCCIFQTFTIFDINMLFTLVFIVVRVCAHRRYSFSVAIIM